ncbi:MAG: DNA polymerase Y family protein [Proteobacteria bacterium]|nr:DNA polymerase Y family protein [Pseudomonadota bacterium]
MPSVPAPAAPVPRTRPVPRQLWLAVRLPALPLVALPREASGPWAVVADDGPRRVLVAANAAAARHGLAAGQALNAARALVPVLEVAARDTAAEARHLEQLARWAIGLTPLVSLEPPDGLLLEVQGSLRLFGGIDALLRRAAADLEARRETFALAVAPTARAATWFARAAHGTVVESAATLAGALGRLPLAVAGWPARTLEDCARLGLATLGELRRLPRDGLARRFEPGVLAALDEAFGLVPAPRRRHVPRERFVERLEPEAELEHVAALEPCCAHLLARLERFLRVRDAGVATLAFTLLHRDHPPTVVRLGRALPAADAAEWRGLLGERLGHVSLPAPVRAIVLRSGAAAAVGGTTVDLPGCGGGGAAAAAGALRLLDRLRARLGEEAVSGFGLVAEHRPEAAFRRLAPGPAAARAGTVPALPAAPRPLWLLATPEPLALAAGRPARGGRLALESGPERIESGWWDGLPVARDYYVARTAGGLRLWIYADRAASGPRRWFLHGLFG